tara:strand:- start:14370 stop:14564 length:195 start_codon:yes stop_codon:yes gene_type:complete
MRLDLGKEEGLRGDGDDVDDTAIAILDMTTMKFYWRCTCREFQENDTCVATRIKRIYDTIADEM